MGGDTNITFLLQIDFNDGGIRHIFRNTTCFKFTILYPVSKMVKTNVKSQVANAFQAGVKLQLVETIETKI